MKRFSMFAMLLVVASLVMAACAPAAPANPPLTVLPSAQPPSPSALDSANPRALTVMTHDSFAASDGLIREFEQANNVKITFLKSGDAGAALNKAILSKDAPLADVFYGLDNTFLSRALDAGIFESYASPQLANLTPGFDLDPKNRALPVDYADVCINYYKAFFTKNDLPVPASLDDLLKPEYNGLLVVEGAMFSQGFDHGDECLILILRIETIPIIGLGRGRSSRRRQGRWGVAHNLSQTIE